MRKTLIFAVLFLLTLYQGAGTASPRVNSSWGLGGGIFAASYSLDGEFMMRLPVLGMNNSFLRTGLSVTDSKHLSSSLGWRRFLPLSVDMIFKNSDDSYFGLGLNYPLKVSDQLTGSIGGQIFMGREFGDNDKFYTEAGYSELRINNGTHFKGAFLKFGYRFAMDGGTVKIDNIEEPRISQKPVTLMSISTGAGLYGGVLSGGLGMAIRSPFGGGESSFLTMGVDAGDSKNMVPPMPWRRVILMELGYTQYICENMYLNASLNYPLKVSDNLTGMPGYRLALGFESDYDLGKLYMEAGIGQVNIQNDRSFAGTFFAAGYRFDLTREPERKRKKTVTPVQEEKKKAEIDDIKEKIMDKPSKVESSGNGNVWVVYGSKDASKKEAGELAKKLKSTGVNVDINDLAEKISPSRHKQKTVNIYGIQSGIFNIKDKAYELFYRLRSYGFRPKIERAGASWVVYGAKTTSFNKAIVLSEMLKEYGFETKINKKKAKDIIKIKAAKKKAFKKKKR